MCIVQWYKHFIKTITLDLMPQKIYFLRLLVSDIQYCTVCPKNKKVPFSVWTFVLCLRRLFTYCFLIIIFFVNNTFFHIKFLNKYFQLYGWIFLACNETLCIIIYALECLLVNGNVKNVVNATKNRNFTNKFSCAK